MDVYDAGNLASVVCVRMECDSLLLGDPKLLGKVLLVSHEQFILGEMSVTPSSPETMRLLRELGRSIEQDVVSMLSSERIPLDDETSVESVTSDGVTFP